MNFGRLATLPVTLFISLLATSARAQEPAAPPEQADDGGAVDLFGFRLKQNERFRLDGEFVAGWSHDGAQAALGFENQARVGEATLTVSGRATSRVRYLVSFNPVNEVSSKPACGEATYFFPNDPTLYVGAGPIVPCDPEDGHKRVDTYNTMSLDYINQQGPLREGYFDWLLSDALSLRGGRFIIPIGFAPPEVGSWTSKDLTRIQRINAEANFGMMLAYSYKRAGIVTPLFEVAGLAMLGDGNRQKDYDWFYFADTSLDSNSGLTGVISARARPTSRLDLRFAYKKGYTGSKIERLPSYWASKRRDDALVASVKAQVIPTLAVFGEYARYVWGPTESSAQMLGIDEQPIVKPGYYIGTTFEVPVVRRARVGVTFTREELSRDDSLVKYLSLQGLYGVELGRNDRGTVLRSYVDVARLVKVGWFWANISNPYPWISGSWPVSGDRAYTGRSPDRYGFTVIVRTP